MSGYVRVFRLVGVASVLAVTASSAAGAGRPAGSAEARWVVTDLGTLGGTNTRVTAINNRGQIIGWSGGRPFLWQNGKMTDLGWRGATAMAINDEGQIVGSTATTSGKSAPTHAVVWQRGKTTRLGALPDEERSEADVINQRGDIAGISLLQAYGGSAEVVLWRDGKTVDLGPPGDEGTDPTVTAINERDQVVGYVWEMGANFQETYYPFIADGKGARVLGAGELQGEAADINERGQVVGEWDLSNGRERACLWQNGRMTNLGTLSGLADSSASAINDRGQIIGQSFSGDVRRHAFIWQSGKMTDLGTLGGDETNAWEINDKGQIIGASTTTSGTHAPPHAFVWQDGTMTSLPALGGRYSYSSEALAINDRGQIFGTAVAKSGSERAVLWTLQRGR